MTANPTRVMIDIETLGLDPGAAIIAIGACTFDTDGVDETFARSIDLESCQDRGLTIDAETLQWWLEQDAAAREQLTGGGALPGALRELKTWADGYDVDEWWAKSPKFDMAHLEAAYDAVTLEPPWAFYELRDVRTLQALPGAVEIEQEGTAHDALDDARHQARAVAATLENIRDTPKQTEVD